MLPFDCCSINPHEMELKSALLSRHPPRWKPHVKKSTAKAEALMTIAPQPLAPLGSNKNGLELAVITSASPFHLLVEKCNFYDNGVLHC